MKIANFGVDVILHNTHSIVAHFYYLMAIAASFAVFAGFYDWIGKMSGRQYPERLGQLHFWTFFPMHFLRGQGMPRRYPDYPDAFQHWHFVSTAGSYVAGVPFLVFLVLVARRWRGGERVPAHPWGEGATALEWQVSSPPPFHTFEELPVLR